MFDQFFMRHFDGKYRSATAPRVVDSDNQGPQLKMVAFVNFFNSKNCERLG